MKNIMTIIILSLTMMIQGCSLTSNAPPLQKVVTTQSTKDELYIKAQDWIIDTFDGNEEILFSSEKTGYISGVYLFMDAATAGKYGDHKKLAKISTRIPMPGTIHQPIAMPGKDGILAQVLAHSHAR